METNYPDIPRICTAMAEWIMCFAYVSFLPKRYTGRKNILFCMIALLLQIFILVSTANVPLKYWILCMILAAGCMFAFIYMCCELTTGQALYCCAIVFILAEFIASLEWQLYIYLLKWNLQFPGENLILLAIIYIGMFWAVFYLEVALLTKDFLQELSVWHHCLKGLLHGYLYGQAGAGAMLDIITGKVNPSGKLNETYPARYEDTPAFRYFPSVERNSEYRESIYVGYRYYDTVKVRILYPFGFGLSYTQFSYSNLKADSKGIEFCLTNIGEMDGSEIIQFYVGKKDARVFRPEKELK